MLNSVIFLSPTTFLTIYNKYYLFFKIFFYLKSVAPGWFVYAIAGNTYHEFNTRTSVLFRFIYYLQNFFGSQVTQLLDITAVDYLIHQKGRFVLYYWFLSTTLNMRYLITCNVDNLNLIPTLSNLYSSANWLEREIWDFFGIYFSGHPDLRRILTDYGFIGYPLRKDFPLSGYFELFYNDIIKSVIYYKNNLAQEFRFYTFLIPWRKF